MYRLFVMVSQGTIRKTLIAGCSKRLRGEAREKSTSGGVLSQYVVARRLSATKHMSLFQQPDRDINIISTDLRVISSRHGDAAVNSFDQISFCPARKAAFSDELF
jgi:hypothetical protein